MNSNSRIFGIAAICAILFGAACKKSSSSYNSTTDTIVSKNGLTMTGSQEVPAVTTPAYGTVNVALNKTTKVLNFSINYYNLSGVPTGSHIHGIAMKGANAGVVYDFFSAFPTTTSGSFSGSVAVDGTKVIEDSVLAGKYYLNIHTVANPGGEIRSQIEF
jgi:hypothetical protein